LHRRKVYNDNNKSSKDFEERPHRRDRFFTLGTMSCDTTDQSGALQPAAAVLLPPLLFFCCVSCRRTDSQNCPSSRAYLDTTHLRHGSLIPLESILQTASRSVQTFLQGSRTWPTDRHTDRRRYSVSSNRPHRMCWVLAMRFHNNKTIIDNFEWETLI